MCTGFSGRASDSTDLIAGPRIPDAAGRGWAPRLPFFSLAGSLEWQCGLGVHVQKHCSGARSQESSVRGVWEPQAEWPWKKEKEETQRAPQTAATQGDPGRGVQVCFPSWEMQPRCGPAVSAYSQGKGPWTTMSGIYILQDLR